MKSTTTKTAFTLAAAGLVALAACQPQSGPAGEADAAAVDTAAAMAGIDSLRSGYAEVVEARDWQALGSLVTGDVLVVGASSPAHDSLRADAGDAPFPPGATLEITPHETRLLAEDWAYEIGTGTVTWTPEGADEPRTASDTYLVIFHRTADGWKLHREVASSNPLPEPGS